jgi:hypothetical protein
VAAALSVGARIGLDVRISGEPHVAQHYERVDPAETTDTRGDLALEYPTAPLNRPVIVDLVVKHPLYFSTLMSGRPAGLRSTQRYDNARQRRTNRKTHRHAATVAGMSLARLRLVCAPEIPRRDCK